MCLKRDEIRGVLSDDYVIRRQAHPNAQRRGELPMPYDSLALRQNCTPTIACNGGHDERWKALAKRYTQFNNNNKKTLEGFAFLQ
jgi:hypothetical protein